MGVFRFEGSTGSRGEIDVSKGVAILSSKGVDGSFSEQAASVLANIDGLLAEAGSDKGRVLHAIVSLAYMADLDALDAAWADWLKDFALPERLINQNVPESPNQRLAVTIVAALP